MYHSFMSKALNIFIAFISLTVSDLFALESHNLKSVVSNFNDLIYVIENLNHSQIKFHQDCIENKTNSKNARKLGKIYSASNDETTEVTVIREAELMDLFNEISSNEDIPFQYHLDGCYLRSHEISRLLEKKGIITGKAFIEGNLMIISSIFKKVEWTYHTAPIVLVEKEGKEIPYIIDPSLFDKPVPLEEWKNKITFSRNDRIKDAYVTNRHAISTNEKQNSPKEASFWNNIAVWFLLGHQKAVLRSILSEQEKMGHNSPYH